MISRFLTEQIEEYISSQKVSILVWPRIAEKLSYLKTLSQKYQTNTIWLNGEDADVGLLLSNQTVSNYSSLLQSKIS